MAEQSAKDQQKKSFKQTLNLPQTNFPIRANAAINDPIILERWKQENLAQKTFEHNSGKETFVLHDGPPYANGNIHIGHAYNKVLKDIIAKFQRMNGKHAPVTPGWDCHGLPIELKVSKDNPDASRTELKKKCREYAQKWIDIQKQEFTNLGVQMDWDNPYLTMNPKYEAEILRAFGQLVEQKYIARKNKTVPWCGSCKTVLATAEIEYQDRKDPSIYVLFKLEQSAVKNVFPQLKDKNVHLLIWTTTPWTLPLNRAVLLRPKTEYVVLDASGTYIIVGKALADKVCAAAKIDKNIVAEFVSDQLVTAQAKALHPFVEGLQVPVLADQMVTLEDGTACVHCAPGCGPQDYDVALKNNLEIFSPLAPDGTYAKGIAPVQLEGMPVIEGQIWVLRRLIADKNLFYKTNIKHPYPHCWRCHQGLMFRATKQWFCDLSQNNLKEKALQEIENVTMLPETSKNRLLATVGGRLEWCLSRQRVWGTPIPAILCRQCDYTHISKELVEKVAQEVAQKGIEYWDTVELKQLLPDGFTCPKCNSSELEKETDILDVWFDSGVSHTAVLKQRKELDFPAQMYLEGKDQHRGWFQSSLLTSMVLNNKAPMQTLITHGFTVDKKGRKMSKSVGNVVSPKEIIDKMGTDGLRLWVSSIDYAGDAVVSDVLINNVKEVFRKIRNTSRFLVSNLYDFDIQKDAVALNKLPAIDQYALQNMYERYQEIMSAYHKYDFTAVFHNLAEYCAVDLSSFYLDIVKDRLYVEQAGGHLRRSAQTVCWHLLDTLTKLMAPILSFTAEQLSDEYQKNKTESIHLQSLPKLQNIWELLAQQYTDTFPVSKHPQHADMSAANFVEQRKVVSELQTQWMQLKQVRSALLKAIEGLRETGDVKHSLEADVSLYIDFTQKNVDQLPQLFKVIKQQGQTIEKFFKELLIVSKVAVTTNYDNLEKSELEGLFVKVQRVQGNKCPRCWHWQITEHSDKLCSRCEQIVT